MSALQHNSESMKSAEWPRLIAVGVAQICTQNLFAAHKSIWPPTYTTKDTAACLALNAGAHCYTPPHSVDTWKSLDSPEQHLANCIFKVTKLVILLINNVAYQMTNFLLAKKQDGPSSYSKKWGKKSGSRVEKIEGQTEIANRMSH